jgi:lysophospholipase L1-like esterase
MKHSLFLAAAICCAASAFATTLFFAGDSTLDDHYRKPDVLYASWGTELERYMKAGNKVDNHARSGASAKSFVVDGYWDRMIALVRPGDFVVIQFGHNDQKHFTEFYRTRRFTSVNGTYEEFYKSFVSDIRAKEATPMFATSIVRGTFDASGKLVDRRDEEGINLRSYADAAVALGKKLSVDVVDMNALTHDLLEKVGKDDSMKFYFISTGLVEGKDGEPSKDTTHPVKAGAESFAKLFLDDVKTRKLPVATLFQ